MAEWTHASMALHTALGSMSLRIQQSCAIAVALKDRLTLTLTRDSQAEICIDLPATAHEEKFTKALPALATVLAYSAQLRAFPQLRRMFWKSLIAGCLVRDTYMESTFQDNSRATFAQIDINTFPVLRINVNLTTTNDRESWLEDALVAFFTTPPAHELPPAVAAQCALPQLIADVVLSFVPHHTTTNQTPERIALLERVLDRVSARPSERCFFRVTCLELGNQIWRPALLAAVEPIVRKCHTVYDIDTLALSNSAQNPAATVMHTAQTRILAAACSASLLDEELRFDASSTAVGHTIATPCRPSCRPSSLKYLRLGNNNFSLDQIAALCSALRYHSSTLESLDLGYTGRGLTIADRAQYWCWLAFALFAPRPRTFAGPKPKTPLAIAVNKEPFTAIDSSAFIAALYDPAGALVYGRAQAVNNNSRSCVRAFEVCVVAAGAVFYANASGGGRSHAVVHTLKQATELEALCCDPPASNLATTDGWTCMVLPGIGLGWVDNAHILRSNSEDNTMNVISPQHRDVAWRWRNLSNGSIDKLTQFFDHVGPRLQVFELSGDRDDDMDVSAALSHCSRLEHLDYSNWQLRDAQVAELFAALDGALGDHLLSLDLGSNYIDAALLEHLLVHRTRPPALLKLRILGIMDDDVDTMTRAMQVNRTLQVLQLASVHSNNAHYAAFYQQAHDELLPPRPLPRCRRLAFLSVLQYPPSKSDYSARHKLDSVLIATVFAFAAFVPIRRRVLGRDTIM